MRFSPTFSVYIIRNLLRNLLFVLAIFAAISFIIDFLELVRESQGRKVELWNMFSIVLCKIPFILYSFLPFIFLFGSILTFTKLNNNYELTAIKSAGMSVWAIGFPVISTVLLLSIFMVFFFQPISALFLDLNTQLGIKYLNYKSKRVSIQDSGIWLYDQSVLSSNDKIIRIQKINKKDKSLEDVEIFLAGENMGFDINLNAQTAKIEKTDLLLSNVKIYKPGNNVEKLQTLTLPINFSQEQIQENIPNPDVIKIWQMPKIINKIKESGFSPIKHKLYWYTQLSSPLLYISIVIISFVCSVNLPRKGKLGIVFVSGSAIGFLLFFINKIFNIYALTSLLPIPVAAIAPSLLYLFISFIALLHYEE